MKKRILEVISVLVFCLFFPASGQGAILSYLGGEFTISAAAFAAYGTDSKYQSVGPISGTDVRYSPTASIPEIFPDIPGYVWARPEGWSVVAPPGGAIESIIRSEIASYDYIVGAGFTMAPPTQPFVAYASATGTTGTGIFYQVTPDSGEQFGDLGTLHIDHGFSGLAIDRAGRPFADAKFTVGPTMVTVNDKTIYSNPGDQGNDFESFSDGDFPIRIGDRIGVIMGWDMVAILSNREERIWGDFVDQVKLGLGEEFIPPPVPLPSSLLFLGTGLLGLLGWRLRRG